MGRVYHPSDLPNADLERLFSHRASVRMNPVEGGAVVASVGAFDQQDGVRYLDGGRRYAPNGKLLVLKPQALTIVAVAKTDNKFTGHIKTARLKVFHLALLGDHGVGARQKRFTVVVRTATDQLGTPVALAMRLERGKDIVNGAAAAANRPCATTLRRGKCRHVRWLKYHRRCLPSPHTGQLEKQSHRQQANNKSGAAYCNEFYESV